MRELLERFEHAIINGDADGSADLADAIVVRGQATPDDIFEHLSNAMEVVGGRYETGEYFIPEMLRSAEAVEKAMAVLEPYLFEHRHEDAGVIVMGTVKGDIHNIGKNIIVSALKATGYDVHDLGVNVSTEKFLNAISETDADLLLLSAFTTSTKQALLDIIAALEADGMREKVKVVSGGASHSEEFAREVGVDGFATDVKSTLALCHRLMNPMESQ
ncbi:MAG: cobalamin B12-binding domain-containing protein [Actinobacteria bacterium]|nr:cobalamin B12-binding domain-containing protein [Actinomycetota bacterium]